MREKLKALFLSAAIVAVTIVVVGSSTLAGEEVAGEAGDPQSAVTVSPVKALYDREVEALSIAGKEGDIREMGVIRDRLLTLAETNPGDPYAARSVVVAGDLETDLGRQEEALVLYDKAASLLRASALEETAKRYLPYLSERTGDALYHLERYEEAAESLKEGVRAYPRSPFIARNPQKVVIAHEKYLEPKEAWLASVAFYDEALELCADSSFVGRFEVERLFFLYGGREHEFFTPERFIEECEQLLGKYPEGSDQFVDRARGSIVASRDRAKARVERQREERDALREYIPPRLTPVQPSASEADELIDSQAKDSPHDPMPIAEAKIAVEEEPDVGQATDQSGIGIKVFLFLAVALVGAVCALLLTRRKRTA